MWENKWGRLRRGCCPADKSEVSTSDRRYDMSKRIFISYRRDDSLAESERLYEFLCGRFGDRHVFRDLDTIRKGYDFVRVIDDNLRTCAGAVVLIGREWLEIKDKAGHRRLDDPEDFVRLEVAGALSKGIPVIPLLVRGATMPERDTLPKDLQPLVRRQISILRDSEFDFDAKSLAKELEMALGFYHGHLSRSIARGLKILDERIKEADIPRSNGGHTLNLATWNIRELGRRKRRKASLHYIAEILSQFDIIGVSEAQRYEGDLRRLRNILGPFWRVLYSGGFTFIFDSRMTELGGIARQVTGLESGRLLRAGDAFKPPFLRNPYVVSFLAGERELVLVLPHVRWGRNPRARVTELEAFAKWLDGFRKSELADHQTLICLGTFQTPDPDDATFRALTENGLSVPKALQSIKGSNIRQDKFYQQILSYPEDAGVFTASGGVVDFCGEDIDRGNMSKDVNSPLYPGTKLSIHNYIRELSDNLPLWVQLQTSEAVTP